MVMRYVAAAGLLAGVGCAQFQQFKLQRRVIDSGSSSFASRHRALQDEAPIYGDFKKLAYFYADVYIGAPAQKFTVITDTGSSLMAVPCYDCGDCGTHMNPRYNPAKSTTARVRACTEGCPGGTSCSGNGRCTYTQSYAEGSSIRGTIYSDNVFVGQDGTSTDTQVGFAIPFNFGCGQHEGGLFTSQEADGIMGLGQGDMSITKALWNSGKLQHNMFSMCLSFTGGALTLGAVDTRLHSGPVQWAAMELTGFYVVKVEGFALEGTNALFGDFNSPHTILDSGTTFTYVPSPAFQRMRTTITEWCRGGSSRCMGQETSVSGESLCYRLSRASDISTFPSGSITLRGSHGGPSVTLRIAPEHLFVNMGWDNGAYCLAVYDNGARGAVIGANAMMGNDVIFDMAGQDGSGPRAGFAPSTCVMPPPEAPSPTPSPSTTPTPSATASDSPSNAPGAQASASSSSAAWVEPSTSPAVAPSTQPAPSTPGSGGSDSKTNGTDTDTPRDKAADGSIGGLGANQQAVVAAGFVGSAVAVCLLIYCCGNCECNCGRINIRLGAGVKGRYAPVDEEPDGDAGDNGDEEDWGDGGPPATDRPRRTAKASRPAGRTTPKPRGSRPNGQARAADAGYRDETSVTPAAAVAGASAAQDTGVELSSVRVDPASPKQ